ncbi:MAG: rod shape-determining protein [Pirellulales bacterium]|nr:rod shape-determining protein [Pirellulales bacterium]
MLRNFSALLRRDLAIDLGTASTRIALPGEGVVVDEPSVVAVSRSANRAISRNGVVGHLARQMQGRTPDSVSVVRPLSAGVIADVDLCETMLRYFLNKARPTRYGLRPRVLITASGCLTQVEKQAIYRSAHRAGMGQVMLLGVAHAAALGAGLPIAEPVAGMIVDIGAGATEVAVFSMGDVVAQRTIRVGGDQMDSAIVDWLRRNHGLRIGNSTAEELRQELGSASTMPESSSRRSVDVRGVDIATSLPKRLPLTQAEIRDALADPLEAILDSIRAVLDGCSPDLVADLVDRGVVLCGGGALLGGLDRWIEERTGIAAQVAPNALTAAAEGALVCLECLDAWRNLVEIGDGAI